jgi:lipid II:glycine glycyltransferase (peptidoglycan interpeptide bridge formation enzyme)
MAHQKQASDNPPPAGWDALQNKLGASFLQSTGWGEFQAKSGNQPHYLLGDGWSCLLASRRTAVGKYLFAPYGPSLQTAAKLDDALKSIRALAKSESADWVRLEPTITYDSAAGSLKKQGARRAPKNVEPSLTRVVDLSPEHDELLASLSQTTRNIIRRSYKNGSLGFKTSSDPDDMAIFSHMLATVASRNRVGFYDSEYYSRQARILMPMGMMRLEVAYLGDKPVGTAVIHDYAKASSYTYAASLPEARDLNVSALLLWQAMLNARSRGMEKMDLFGIAPDNAPASHPWAGFSSFKKKFGGTVIEHAGTWDIPISGKYRLYRIGSRARRLAGR